VRFYLNEASVQGQFADVDTFRSQLEALLAARGRSRLLAAMRTTPALANRHVMHDRTIRDVVQTWRGSPTASALLRWVGKTGPFIEEDRLPEDEDLFMCLGIEVTDGGLGEAARRKKAADEASTMSFAGGEPDFARNPLTVVHGFEDEPIGSFDVDNYWTADEHISAATALEPPPSNCLETVESARERFPRLLLPNAIYENDRLAREPFDAVLRDRVFALLAILDAYMAARGPGGAETARAQEIIENHFSGDRALFSPESASNRKAFEAELTFPDPLGGAPIFAHWHGKISHRFYRLHFEWPVAAASTELKVLYIGPKLTKS
jgi:hypothetical protein